MYIRRMTLTTGAVFPSIKIKGSCEWRDIRVDRDGLAGPDPRAHGRLQVRPCLGHHLHLRWPWNMKYSVPVHNVSTHMF